MLTLATPNGGVAYGVDGLLMKRVWARPARNACSAE